jgi:hypothetical protein
MPVGAFTFAESMQLAKEVLGLCNGGVLSAFSNLPVGASTFSKAFPAHPAS